MYACVRSVDIFLLHEHSLWEFLSFPFSLSLTPSISPFLPRSLHRLPPPLSHPALPGLIPRVTPVGKVGGVGFQIIATQYIDPERHIDRCGRERNNNLHCYCEPIRRNQTGPARSSSCSPFPCIPMSRWFGLSLSPFLLVSSALLVHYLRPSPLSISLSFFRPFF